MLHLLWKQPPHDANVSSRALACHRSVPAKIRALSSWKLLVPSQHVRPALAFLLLLFLCQGCPD
eukprot:4261088-Amphidinium_carterae.1